MKIRSRRSSALETRVVRRARRAHRTIGRMLQRIEFYGLWPAVRLTMRDRIPGAVPIDLDWPGYRASLRVRLGQSDLRVLDDVIAQNSYEPPFAFEPRVIIDAGANIGLTSIWFAIRHPNAAIIAVEPDLENFRLLERNVAAYPNIRVVRAALWSHTGEVNLTDPGTGAWGLRVGPSDAETPPVGASVPAVDMPSLLKVDIEGGELDVFRDASAWIDRVDVIAIELHDRDLPGCARTFFRATGAFEVEATRGETTWVARRAAVADL